MSLRFTVRHAWRESRASWRRLALYMSSITLGVAALVAINSFRANARRSVEHQARELMGADLVMWSNRPYQPRLEAMLDSANARGDLARVTVLISMGANAQTGDVRLVQVRAADPGYPFYGDMGSEPREAWSGLRRGGVAVVDASLLSQLNLSVGDSLLLGNARFLISGSISKPPADFTMRNLVGPRVFITASDLPKTGLLRFGSLAQYMAYVRMPNAKALDRFVAGHRGLLQRNLVGFRTAQRQGETIGAAIDALGRFLGLIGLAALLLGGIGVATAVHVFVKSKRPVVAVLRCLGATERVVFGAYLLQASVLALLGAALGVLLGLGIQLFLPALLRSVVPFDVPFAIDWLSVVSGLGVGLGAAILFAFIPLLSIRGVSPLQALRVEYEPPARRVDFYRVAAFVLLAVGMVAISIWQAGNEITGLGFAAGLGATVLVLLLVASTLTWIARRLLPRSARFTIRQGIANLYRPHNQTLSITLSLGFGVFVIATMLCVQSNLLSWLNIEGRANAPNVLAFDIQDDERSSVANIFAQHGVRAVSITPIVPARIKAINGKSIDSLAAHAQELDIEPWTLRREYRNTYRDTIVDSEKVVSGRWFSKQKETGSGTAIAPVSVEQGVAHDLHLKLGDRVTWDFQGVAIESRVASLRKVDWAQFSTNFFVVFPTGVIENAPHTFVALGRLEGAQQRVALQRDLVAANPNVSVIDLATVRAALDEILGKIMLAVRFMAIFSIGAGVIVLIGGVATSRFQRLRESALLKALGATRRQIVEVLVTEYAALGIMSGATGVLLGGVASWLLMKYFFKLDYHAPLVALSVTWLGVVMVAVLVGVLNSREVLRRSPLAALREASGEA